MPKLPKDMVMICYPSKAQAPEHLQSLDGWYYGGFDGFHECVDAISRGAFLKEQRRADSIDEELDKRLEEVARLKLKVRELRAENKVLLGK